MQEKWKINGKCINIDKIDQMTINHKIGKKDKRISPPMSKKYKMKK